MAVFDPNDVIDRKLRAIKREEEREDAAARVMATPEAREHVGRIVVKKMVHYPDPDLKFDRIIREVDTRIATVDAKLLERSGRGYKAVHYRSLQEMMRSPTVKRRMREAYNAQQLGDLGERLLEIKGGRDGKPLRESSSFSLGLYDDEVNPTDRTFRVQDVVLPALNSPYSKQQLFVDYQDMHRKCWEAATRNPIAKRIIKIIPQFVLGRGLAGKVPSSANQNAWDDFWDLNGMQLEIKQFFKELLIYGEIFLRYFNTREGLQVRSIDPSTIWDIVTDAEDLKKVLYYHQQYVILNTTVIPGLGANLAPSRLIIRQIPAEDVDHFKINSTSSEKRGRSELFAILGWLQRFKEFANDRVLLNKMRAMFALDVKVTGDATEVAAAEEQFSTPPGPGAVMIHNDAVETEFKNANTNANEAKTDGELLLKIIAIGAGVSEQFLGVGSAQTRAGALIQTEPDVKNFEDYQEIIEVMMRKAYNRVVKAKRLPKTEARFEVVFASIAQEDRSTKLKDLAMAEAQDWLSKHRTSTMAAREFNVTSYDFESEQDVIRKERQTDPVVMQGYQSVSKVAPDPMATDVPPALAGAPGEGDTTPVVQTSGQMGFSAKGKSGRNLADTRPTLDRGSFTRGGEKTSIQNRRSAGAPTYESNRRGWTDAARAASLATRRQNRLRRQGQQETGE